MSDTVLPIGVDPKAALAGMQKIADSSKELSATMEEALGKNAPKAVQKMEDAAEKGATRISTFFRNLGTRVKEDLKTAFDLGAVAQGLNMAKGFSEGVKQVFDMERAFSKLNTRLGLTNSQMLEFKRNVGNAAAAAGQNVQDILPGVETASAKGGVKDPMQLSAISSVLAEARTSTGEDVSGLSESIVDILKDQGKQVNAQNFKATMDAIQGTRVSGNFSSAGDAAKSIQAMIHDIRPEDLRKMGLDTRTAGGIAAAASTTPGGLDAINHLLKAGGNTPGQQANINSIFGADIFKNGKLQADQLGKIKKSNLGGNSGFAMSQALGVDQADLGRMIDSFAQNMDKVKQVTEGADENSKQFAVASDNFSFEFDKFKATIKTSASQIGSGLSSAAHAIIHGDTKGAGTGLGQAMKSAWENKGTLAAGLGLSVGSAAIAGGGLRSLFGKIGGGMIGGKMAEAAGVQPVYVTNAAEIGGGGGIGAGVAGAGMGLLGKAGLVGAAGAAGFGIGTLINQATGNTGQMGEKLYDWLNPGEDKASTAAGTGDSAAIAKAVHDATIAAHDKINAGKRVQITNPSAVASGGGR